MRHPKMLNSREVKMLMMLRLFHLPIDRTQTLRLEKLGCLVARSRLIKAYKKW